MAFFELLGSAASDLFAAKGAGIAAEGYDDAAKLAGQNVKLSKGATRIRLAQQDREAYKIIGGAQADIAGGGFAASGTALDIMRANASEAAMDYGMIGIQGAIQTNDFKAQKVAYESSADQARMEQKGGFFSAAIKGIAAGASLFLSDRSMKEDIRQIGRADNGLPIYAYRLKGEKGTRIGFMADEVEQVHPNAVKKIAGVLMVDYAIAVGPTNG